MNDDQAQSIRQLPALFLRRSRGEYEVDLWGADSDWIDIISTLTKPALRVRVDGFERIPREGGTVLVTNTRIGLAESFALAVGVRRKTGRLARPLGVPSNQYVAPMVRRIGSIRANPKEIKSVLAAGNLIICTLTPSLRREAGTIAPELLAPALDLGLPVLPVATVGGELSGSWRVCIGEGLPTPSSKRRTPLAAAELADRARAGVQELLDDHFPPRRG